jgi:tripartite-type tricarboxylate transporter receptor subunit TctC
MSRYRAAVVSICLLAACGSASAQDKMASHFAGKTVRIVVGYPSGSGFDVYARSVARHMGKHIPGSPTVIVQNMPGAGGLTSVAYMANVAPRDGLTLALINPVNSTEPLLQPEVAKFDSTKFKWLGSVNKDVQTCVFWTQKAKTAEDMKNVELILGATGPSSGSALDAKTLASLLGFKFKIVMGYPGIADIRLAAEKGEVDGHCGMPLAQIKTDIWEGFKSGRIKALIQIATADYPELKGIPNAFDLAQTPDDRKILNLVFAPWTYGRPMLAPPETPETTVATLRKAFDDTMKDPAFLAEAKQINLDVNPLDGAAVEKLVQELFATPKPLIERTRTILGIGGK